MEDGNHTPVIPSSDLFGRAGGILPIQNEFANENDGGEVGKLMFIEILEVMPHCPALGVNV